MRRSNKSWWVAALVGGGLLLPSSARAEETPTAPPAETPKVPAVRDVALSKDGALLGRVVNDQGKALDGVVVKLRREDADVAETTTRTDGRFRFATLKGGVYQVQTPQSESAFRLWTADAAPDQSLTSVVMTNGAPVARGQLGYLTPSDLVHFALEGAAVGLGTAAIIKLDDLEDDVNRPASP